MQLKRSMSKKITISKETCAEFNKFRAENQDKILSREEVLSILRSFGYKGKHFLSIGVKLGILNRVKQGKYQFCKEPVHISKLQTLRKTANEMCRKFRSNSKETPQTTEEIAIDLLKSLGYRIQRPQIDIEAAMENPEQPVKNFIKFIEIR